MHICIRVHIRLNRGRSFAVIIIIMLENRLHVNSSCHRLRDRLLSTRLTDSSFPIFLLHCDQRAETRNIIISQRFRIGI